MVPDSDWAIEAGLTPGTIVPGCTPSNPLIARWIGITPSKQGIGIHGTNARNTMGQRASHGCIRMLEEDVVELYSMVPRGTQVMIVKSVDW
jgi:L,D-transpeptidase ErfK/SrfK